VNALSSHGIVVKELDGIIVSVPLCVAPKGYLTISSLIENGFPKEVYNVVVQSSVPSGCKFIEGSVKVFNKTAVPGSSAIFDQNIVRWFFPVLQKKEYVEIGYVVSMGGGFTELGKMIVSTVYFAHNVDPKVSDLRELTSVKCVSATSLIGK
jgi:hypothetical protein